METTANFKFEIPSTERAVNLGELQDVIKTIRWRLTATHESGTEADTHGVIYLETPNPDTFIPYEEITEDLVIGWVENYLETVKEPIIEDGIEKSTLAVIKERLEKDIALKISPEIIIEPLPVKSN